MTTTDQTAVAVLVAHQRHTIRGCLCGWGELGRSHPGHQVAMLREAGVLQDELSPAAVAPTGGPLR